MQAESELIRNWRDNKETPAAKVLLGKRSSSNKKSIQPDDLTAKEIKEQHEITGYKKGLKGTTQKTMGNSHHGKSSHEGDGG